MAELKINVNTTGVSKVKTLEKNLSDLEKQEIKTATATKKLDDKFKSLADGTQVFIDKQGRVREANGRFVADASRINEALGKTDNALTRTTAGFGNLSTAVKIFAGVAVVGYATKQIYDLGSAFISTADEMSMLDSRLRLATNGIEAYTTAQQNLFNIAQENRVEFSSTVDLYSTMARATESLNISQNKLLTVTDSISKALIISGGSAESAQAALTQLGQGFASGTLRGEELNSVMEQTPRLAKAIADGMGVSIGELRKLGSEGLITAETVIKSLENQAGALKKEFLGVAVTIDSGWTTISNSIELTIKKTDEYFGITSTIGTAFVALSEVADIVFNNIIEGYGDSSTAVEIFAEYVVGAVGGFIGALGAITDIFNGIGLVVDSVQLGIYAIMSPIQTLANMVNTFLNGILASVDALGKLAGFGGVSYRIPRANFAEEGIKSNLASISENFNQLGKGAELAEQINLQMSTKFAELRLAQNALSNKPQDEDKLTPILEKLASDYEANKSKYGNSTDPYQSQRDETSAVLDSLSEFGSALSDIDLSNLAGEYANNEDIQNKISEMLLDRNTSSTEDNTNTFNYEEALRQQEEYEKARMELFYGKDGEKTALNDTNEAIEDIIDTVYNNDDSLYETITKVDDKVQDTSSSLNDLSTSANNADYGINKVIDSMDKFIFQFSDTLLNSIENNINKLNQIGQDTAFTSVTYSQALSQAVSARNDLISNPLDVGIGEVYTTAYNQFIDSATDYLADTSKFESATDLAFARTTVGIQAGQFKDTANQSVDVLTSMNNFLSTINQAFADGILSDEEKQTIAGVANEVNQNNDLLLGNTSSNTIKTSVEKLMGSGSEGISLSSVASGLPALSVATGLDVSELSNLSNIKDATEYATADNTTSLKNLQIKSTRMSYQKYEENGNVYDGTNLKHGGVNTDYYYMAKGGYTGYGMGQKDSTGFKQAGIVHEGEYVLPKWMVDAQPTMVSALESVRKKGSFAQGGYTTPKAVSSNSSGYSQENILMNLTREIVELKMTIKNGMSGDSFNMVMVG